MISGTSNVNYRFINQGYTKPCVTSETVNEKTVFFQTPEQSTGKIVIHPSGNEYIGEHLNGKPHGSGVVYYKSGKIMCFGRFENGELRQGSYEHEIDGKIYQYNGMLEKNLPSGMGYLKLTYATLDVETYYGEFKNGEFYNGTNNRYFRDGVYIELHGSFIDDELQNGRCLKRVDDKLRIYKAQNGNYTLECELTVPPNT